ncbi:Mia40p [Sporobolomyces koalae]|uniref:Mia40p n=1 Tax=Sporobolomyces koalae TaxID=500713 RepID=UPI00316BADDC
MFRAPLRTLPRSFVSAQAPVGRRFASESAANRGKLYRSQTTRPIVVASLGLAALFGWTAVFVTVGNKKDKKALVHEVKEQVQETVKQGKYLARFAAPAEPPRRQRGLIASAMTVAVERRPPVVPESLAPSTETAQAPPTAASSEEDHSQAAAFNPETGEINWDCPCLGGMADGPCGEDFKAAFSCFVYSEAEPKGVDCVEKFRKMQECFRKHPDIYGNDTDDLDDEDADEYDLITRAEAALALPDEHFLEKVAEAVDESKSAK